VVLVLAACSLETSPEESTAQVAAPDTALLSAAAVAIANFALDTARVVAWTSTVSAPARVTLDPSRHQTLGSITEGRITRVLVRVGDAVRAGDILVAIHSHEIMDARSGVVRAESQMRTAVAERDAAQITVQRAERLLAARAMGQADMERARVTLTAAQARFDEAQAEAERAHGLLEHLLGDGPVPANLDPHEVLIRAPMNGVVTERTAVPGTVVLPGDPLLAVADPSALQLEIRLTDRQIAGVSAGDSIRFALVGTDDADAIGTARVTRVSPVLDQETRTTTVVATITRAPAGTRAERFATAVLSSSAEGEALVVPAQAIQSLAGDTVVIVAEQRGEGLHIVAVPVRVGRRDAAHAEILAGLEVGRVVIARGATIARAELLKRREGEGGAEH
jgi:cobalt-zinc-cadmium efflux system membrane fusion protein